MDQFVQSKRNKNILVAILVIAIPFWLPLLNYIFSFLIQAGRIIGTYIRLIGSGTICPF